jgi:hypothetical protein
VRKTLDVWPPLPIEIESDSAYLGDNILAALEQSDRVRGISLYNIMTSQTSFVAAMQGEFPALEQVYLLSMPVPIHETVPPLHNTFLGGSAPRLKSLTLEGIPLPTLPKPLSFSKDLVHLCLSRIPHNGYMSPEAMSTSLTALTSLKHLFIDFESPASFPDQRPPPPMTPAVHPALTDVFFRGVSEYLEGLVARIDAPQLEYIDITLFNQLVFDVRELPRFIHHAPVLMSYKRAKMEIGADRVLIKIRPLKAEVGVGTLAFGISCKGVDWQVSSMAQICSQASCLFSGIEQLDIQEGISWSESNLEVDMDDTQWLELLHSFTAVKTLRISRRLQPLILPALQELGGESATGVLPTLDNLYLLGSEQSDIERFMAARQVSDYPVAVHRWEREEMKKSEG